MNNRIYKFRAWNGEQMIYPSLEGHGKLTSAWILQNYDNAMQFTGLCDKNGKGNDVYEGDNFEAIYKDCPDGFSIMGKETTVIKIIATVVFRWGKFMVETMHPEYKKLVYSSLYDFLKNEEKVVIGNIYETPELIKK